MIDWNYSNRLKESQGNIPHIFSPPPPSWTVDKAGWVYVFMLLEPVSDPTICAPLQYSRFIKVSYIYAVFKCLLILYPLQLSAIG